MRKKKGLRHIIVYITIAIFDSKINQFCDTVKSFFFFF